MTRKSIFVLFFLSLFLFTPRIDSLAQGTINIRDFGAVPDDGKDDTKALRRAAAFCREHPGTTLVIPPGVYRLRDAEAEKLEQEVLAGKFGNNPEKTIYTPYYPYVKGLDFAGSQNLTIRAKGATLLCEGWMEPVSFTHCRNVRMEGLTIDYKRQPYSYGEVINVTDEFFDVRFTDDRKIEAEMPFTRGTFWIKENKRLYPGSIYFPGKEILGGNVVRIRQSVSKELEGSIFGVLHSFHFRPAILIQDSRDILLRNVTIHSQPGMGIVGFDSGNITLERLAVVPAPGKYFSTNTDATHFACCDGLLRFDQCSFQAQGDDATNVHGYYQTIKQAQGHEATIKVEAVTYTHSQVLDKPRPGDTLKLVEKQTLQPVKHYTVQAVHPREADFETDITLSDDLPADFDNYYLMNVSKLPKLEFVNSTVNSHLARGILVKTRDVLIDNNSFTHCTGTAIHVGAESGWHEGSHAKNVQISNNFMIGCGSGDGSQGNASGIAVVIEAENTENTYLHENILIQNNTIVGEGNPCGIYVSNASGVRLEGNIVHDCEDRIRLNSVKDVSVNP